MNSKFVLSLVFSFLMTYTVIAQYNDVPVTELYNTGAGNFQVAQGGTSFYPFVTSGTFTVDVPACAAGTPTIDKVYINYYERYRTNTGLTPEPAFENNIDIEVNGSGVQNFAAVPANIFKAVIQSGPRAFYRNHVVLDITSFFTANYQAGSNTINISNFNLPPLTSPAPLTNDHYGVAITVIYSCDEFEEASVSYYSGLDFYWVNDAGVDHSGPYSAPVCITVPPDANNSRDVSVKSILGGQANDVAPFRGNRVYYLTGTGTPPTDPSIQPTGVVATDVNAIELVPQNTAYTSNLGQEWDAMDATISLPAGDEWICIQYVSEDYDDNAVTIGGISGDVLAPVFTVPAVQAISACVTPVAGDDVAICLPKTTLKLKDAPSGTEWVVTSGSATIDVSTGAITGLSATGVYTFTLQNIGDPTCSDDIIVTVSAATPYVLCNDGSTSVTASAEPGLSNIIWYNEAGTQVGIGESLVITSNIAGLADGNDWFYYTAKDANDCDVELCCPVVIITEDCCPTPNCLDISVIKN
jgi:hypothetical protein